jgi:hypothetical protein
MSQREILKELNKGGVIYVEHITKPASNAHTVYRCSKSLRLVREETIKKMLEGHLIRPNADGLFGIEGPVQSYSLWRASQGGA